MESPNPQPKKRIFSHPSGPMDPGSGSRNCHLWWVGPLKFLNFLKESAWSSSKKKIANHWQVFLVFGGSLIYTNKKSSQPFLSTEINDVSSFHPQKWTLQSLPWKTCRWGFFRIYHHEFRQTVGLARQQWRFLYLKKTTVAAGFDYPPVDQQPGANHEWRQSGFCGRLPQNVEKICGKPKISENLCQRIKQNCPQDMKKAGHVGSQNWGIQEWFFMQIMIDGFGSLWSHVFLVEEAGIHINYRTRWDCPSHWKHWACGWGSDRPTTPNGSTGRTVHQWSMGGARSWTMVRRCGSELGERGAQLVVWESGFLWSVRKTVCVYISIYVYK